MLIRRLTGERAHLRRKYHETYISAEITASCPSLMSHVPDDVLFEHNARVRGKVVVITGKLFISFNSVRDG